MASISFVCIVHSSTVSETVGGPSSDEDPLQAPSPFSASIIADALLCVRGFATTYAAAGADFTASIAVLRADPIAGCQCVHQQFIPRTVHPVPPSLTALHTTLPPGEGGHSPWATRSTGWIEQSVRHGLEARAQLPAGAGPPAPRDRWGCLAGALLTACAVLNKQRRASGDATGAVPGAAANGALDVDTGENVDEDDGAGAAAASRRTVVVVLTEGTEGDDGDTELSLVSESAFAVAATVLSKQEGLTLNCFGAALPTTEEEAEEGHKSRPSFSPGARRLVALAHTLGGRCMPHLHPNALGAALCGGGGAVASAPSTLRGQSRLTRHYVMPVVTAPPVPSRTSAVEGRTAPLCGTDLLTHTAWLCPQCMCCSIRGAATRRKTTRNGERAGAWFPCPVCSNTEFPLEPH